MEVDYYNWKVPVSRMVMGVLLSNVAKYIIETMNPVLLANSYMFVLCGDVH